jgi:hypothetical protein
MSERIAPALTPDEWAAKETRTPDHVRVALLVDEDGTFLEVGDGRSSADTWLIASEGMPQTIALANAALPDSDPRKITRARVDALREVAREIDAENKGMITQCGWADDFLNGLADALESYLPPE